MQSMHVHLKETVIWGNITWSEVIKQNIKAKKVYFLLFTLVRRTDCGSELSMFFALIYFLVTNCSWNCLISKNTIVITMSNYHGLLFCYNCTRDSLEVRLTLENLTLFLVVKESFQLTSLIDNS